jgi:hypothetical protein
LALLLLAAAAGYLALRSARTLPIGLDLSALATWGTVERTVVARAYVLRDETVLAAPAGGTVRTLVAQGERVRPGQSLAELVDLADRRDTEAQLAELDKRIRALAADAAGSRETIAAETARATVGYQSALARLGQIVMSGARGAFAEAWQDLNAASRTLAAAEGRLAAVAQRAQDLERQREQLMADLRAPGTAIVSQVQALVSFVFDGQEDLRLSEVWDLGAREFLRLGESADQVRSGRRIAPGQPVLKLVSPARAQLVMLLEASVARRMSTGDRVVVRFPGGGDAVLQATVARVGDASADGTAKVQVDTDGILPRLVSGRWTGCELILSSRSGVLVPRSVLVYREGQTGVLALSRASAYFRAVTVLDTSGRQALVHGVSAGTALARYPWLWVWLGKVR